MAGSNFQAAKLKLQAEINGGCHRLAANELTNKQNAAIAPNQRH